MPLTHLIDDLNDLITHSPTSYHAVVEMGMRLASLDFHPLSLEESWKLAKGGKYFVLEEGTLCAFVLPKNKPKAIAIAAAHTDSPALKLKPHPDVKKKNMTFLGVEVYGSPILETWINRDLAIAGRVQIEEKDGEISEDLVFFEDVPVIIPMIAPHLNRKKEELDKQNHLRPIVSVNGEELSTSFVEALLKRERTFAKLLGFDLFLVPIDPPRHLGLDGEMLAGYRLDNLSSAHAALSAIGHKAKASEDHLPMAIFWDHEEIGSATSSGAESPFFKDVMTRIESFYRMTPEEESILRRHSLCLSVDVTHCFNPNFEKKYDPEHTALMGKGIVIKHSANMRYMSSGKGSAFVTKLCELLNIGCQTFVNRNDNRPGTTIGPVFAKELGIPTVDIGLPQLSMHAAREVISCDDQIALTTFLTTFLAGGEG